MPFFILAQQIHFSGILYLLKLSGMRNTNASLTDEINYCGAIETRG